MPFKLRCFSYFVSLLPRLFIEWDNRGKTEMDEIIVNVVNDTKAQCYDHDFEIKNWVNCAKFNNYRDCVKACGLGTGGAATYDKR